jgi:hypothetical protein
MSDEDQRVSAAGGGGYENRVTPSDANSASFGDFQKLSAGKAFKIVYGINPDVYIAADEEGEGGFDYGNARDWWERASAITQCINVIGPCKYGTGKNTNATICYICGFPIMQGDGTAECEHVLPVFKASLYMTLYNTQQYKDIMASGGNGLGPRDKEIYDELKMEYRWAHRCCNQKKNEIDFIGYNPDGTGAGGGTWFTLDKENATTILNKIYTGLTSSDGHCNEGSLTRQFKNLNKDRWIEERITALNVNSPERDNPVPQIIRHLNQKWQRVVNKATKGMIYLSTLSSLIGSADMNKVWAAWDVIDGNQKNRPRKPPKLDPIIIVKEAEVLAIVAKQAQDASKIDWGDRRNLGKEGRPKIFELYKSVFYCDGVKIPLAINFNPSGDKITRHELLPAILDSLIKQKQKNGPVGNFFTNFCAILTQRSFRSNYEPLFSLATPTSENDEITKRTNQETQSNVADIVGESLKVILFARMVNRCDEKAQEFNDNLNPQYLGFQENLVKNMRDAVQSVLDKLGQYFSDDKLKKCKFLRMLLNLCQNIDHPLIENRIKEAFNYDTLCNNAGAIEVECQEFTNNDNINNALVNDFINNSDEEWNVKDIANDQERAIQNVANAAKIIRELQQTPLSDEQISFFADDLDRQQLLDDLKTYIEIYKIETILQIPTGRWLGEGLFVSSIDNLTNDELKYALENLQLRQQEAEEAATVNNEEQARDFFYNKATEEFKSQQIPTGAGAGYQRPSMFSSQNNDQQIQERSAQLYSTWVENGRPLDANGRPLDAGGGGSMSMVMGPTSSSDKKASDSISSSSSSRSRSIIRPQSDQKVILSDIQATKRPSEYDENIKTSYKKNIKERTENGGKNGGGEDINMGGSRKTRKRAKKTRRRNTRRPVKRYNKKSLRRYRRKSKTRKR